MHGLYRDRLMNICNKHTGVQKFLVFFLILYCVSGYQKEIPCLSLTSVLWKR